MNDTGDAAPQVTAAQANPAVQGHGGPTYGHPTYGQPVYGQPVYGQPQPGYGYPPPHGAPGFHPVAPTSRTAVVALVLAFFVPIIGITLGWLAYAQIRQTGQQGKVLAAAAIAVSCVNIALGSSLLVSLLT